jgi:hypothetical protein
LITKVIIIKESSRGTKSVPSDLPAQLSAEGIRYTSIGDFKKARKFLSATLEGFYAALDL